MKTKKIESYRDLNNSDVQKYADKKGLNIESEENYREAAIALFNERFPAKKQIKTRTFIISATTENGDISFSNFVKVTCWDNKPINPDVIADERMMKYWGNNTYKNESGAYCSPDDYYNTSINRVTEISESDLEILNKYISLD